MIKIGDTVAYIRLPDKRSYNGGEVNIGTVYYISPLAICLGRYGHSSVTIKTDDEKYYYEILSDNTKDSFINILEYEISQQKSQIRTLTSMEKDAIKKEAFDKKKEQIIATAKHMVESTDDTEFINRLKAIVQLKKELFTIKISDIDNVHKSNGSIKHMITLMNKLLSDVREFDFKLL